MTDSRVANTSDLRSLVADADRRGFNRRMVLPENTDDTGYHLVSRVLYGHNMDDRSRPLHHRCRVMVKVADSPEPVIAYLDVTDTAYDALPSIEAFIAARDGLEVAS